MPFSSVDRRGSLSRQGLRGRSNSPRSTTKPGWLTNPSSMFRSTCSTTSPTSRTARSKLATRWLARFFSAGTGGCRVPRTSGASSAATRRISRWDPGQELDPVYGGLDAAKWIRSRRRYRRIWRPCWAGSVPLHCRRMSRRCSKSSAQRLPPTLRPLFERVLTVRWMCPGNTVGGDYGLA
jgi:hypothetical protein